MAEQTDLEEELRRARETIASQAAELDSLRAAREDVEFAARLRFLLRQAGAAAAIREPEGEDGLLEMLIQTAARVTGAAAASLMVIDASAGSLVFKAATGPKAAEIRQFVVPLGQGIAGFVAETGQPMAVSNVGADPRFHRDIGQALGYIPNSMLCVPVRKGDEILGVIELLDKTGGASFTSDDMELVGSFVEQAAVAIEQSRDLRDLTHLLLESLRRAAGADAVTSDHERGTVAFARREQAQSAYSLAIQLGAKIAEIAGSGDAEVALLQALLDSFMQYLQARQSLRY